MFDSTRIKKDFPIFQHHPKLVYLDSTASALKPRQVIEAEREYYEQYGVNVHRGLYALSVKATEMYEGAREKVRKFINAKSTKEVIFVRGTTEGINLAAATLGQTLKSGDVILLSEMEHHANIVPWQRLRDERSITLRWIPLHDHPSAPPHQRRGPEESTLLGELDLSNIDELLKGVKLVAVTQMSNVLGVVNDVKFLAEKAHAVGAKILVDAAQSVPHMPVDVQDLDADFLVFSGHKMCGPTGIGVLYAKEEVLKTMEPYQRGGDMILEVTKAGATWNELPWKFEAGTPNIAGAIGLGAAVDYLQAIGMKNIWQHEQELARYGLERLAGIEGVRLLGVRGGATPPNPSLVRRGDEQSEAGWSGGRAAIFAFELQGIHPHDIGSILGEQSIAVRAGHHCAQPLHARFGLTATTRASCYLYNSKKDIDALVQAIEKVKEMFA